MLYFILEKKYLQERYPEYKPIKDTGNFKRKGLYFFLCFNIFLDFLFILSKTMTPVGKDFNDG